MGDLTLGLFPDFVTSGVVVSVGVGNVTVLVQDDGLGNFLLKLLSHTNVRFGGVPSGFGGGSDDLSAKSLEHRHLFVGHLFGQSDDGSVTSDGTDKGQTNTGVTRGGFNQSVAIVGLDTALLFGFEDHVFGDPVLDRTTGIEQLNLGVDLTLDPIGLGDLVKSNKGGVTNEI